MARECPRCGGLFEDSFETCPEDGSGLDLLFAGVALLDRKYRLERRLGRGGMGSVYKALHVGLGRHFALKLLGPQIRAQPRFLGRFHREAEALGRLKHENIVPVTDFGVDPREGGLPYLVLELLAGQDLQSVLEARGPIPPGEALPWLEALARGIDFAHARGVLHRDLKPCNVFLSREGDAEPRIRILDFGLARLLVAPETPSELVEDRKSLAGPLDSLAGFRLAASRLTSPDGFVGTVHYLAPEALLGEPATPACDIYSLGILIYEVLVGRVPFEGRMREVARQQVEAAPPRPCQLHASLPPEMDETLLAPLCKDPSQRPATAKAVVQGLVRALLQSGQRQWRAREIPRRVALSAALALLLALAAIGLASSPWLRQLENWSVDLRFRHSPSRPPDPRLLLLTLDEESLEADPTPLSERADEFGRRLEAVYEAGAKAVAIDLLLPQRWSHSREFSRLVLRHADSLTLAAQADPTGRTIGPEVLTGFTTLALGSERAAELFGFANLEADGDGILRRVPGSFPGQDGRTRDSWALRAVRTLLAPRDLPDPSSNAFLVDWTADWKAIPRVSWKDLPAVLGEKPAWFRNRLVVLGAEFTGSGDFHRVPSRDGQQEAMPGVLVHALAAHTLLDERSIRGFGRLGAGLSALFWAGAVLAGGLLLERFPTTLGMILAMVLLYWVLSFVWFRWDGLLLPLAVPCLATLLAAVLATVLRRFLNPFPQLELEKP